MTVAGLIGLSAVAEPAGTRAGQDPPLRDDDRPAPAQPVGSVRIQLLGVNDFHGQLDSPKSVRRPGRKEPVPVGGAANLAAHLDRAERAAPGRTIRVHAGDMLGASPLISSHFHDEPSIEAMNLMKFDVGTLGNHEFDEGGDELLRLLHGGHRNDGLQKKLDADGRSVDTSGERFDGVDFPYVSANVEDREGHFDLPPTKVVKRAGVKIGFIGVATPTTPTYLLRERAARFRFGDMSDTVNRYATELRSQGVGTIVVLAHAGGRDEGEASAEGEIIDEARQMSNDVDVVVSAHTHTHLNVRVPNSDGGGEKLVVQANAMGIAYDRITLDVDPRSGKVLSKSAATPATWADEVRPDGRVEQLVDGYRRRVAPLAAQTLGRARRALHREADDRSRSGIGLLAAKAQRSMAHADIALVNEGNARDDVPSGPITYEDIFRASAYEFPVLRMSLTGQQVQAALAAQYASDPPVRLHMSGPSRLQPNRRYTVAVNQLLAEQPGFSSLAAGRDVRTVGTDLDALVRYVRARRWVG